MIENKRKIMSKSMIKKKLADCRLKTEDLPYSFPIADCRLKTAYLPILLMTIIFFLTHTTESHPTIRYVSPTGNNIPPYLSWEDAANKIQDCINVSIDGDTIYVANGVYADTLVVDKAIYLIGSSMDSTIIDGRGIGAVTIQLLADGQFNNFTIYGKGENFASTIILGNNQYVEVINCRLSEAGAGVLALNKSSRLENVIMTKLRRALGASCLWGNCMNDIDNSIIILDRMDSQAFFLEFRGEYSFTNNIILFTGNQNNNPSSGIFIHADRINISNNLISGFNPNIFVHIIIDTGFVINNILTNARRGILSDVNRIVIKNNILTNMNGAADVDQYVNWNYNLFWNNSFNLWDTPYGDRDIVADPMFVKDTIPNSNFNYDFHLQKYSPAIDAGDPNILDVDGSRSDIGMFGGPLGQKYTYMDLAPKPPSNLTTTLDSGLVLLKWNKNTEADLYRYRVYRDTIPNFIYDTTKIVAVVADTFYYDIIPDKYSPKDFYYKLTAIDSAYNQSAASEEVHVNITGIPEAPPVVVEHYRLLQNYPNPFNPSTTIPYRLKEPGYVKVMVYNLLGELVRVLVNQWQDKGYYEVLFQPDRSERGRAEGIIEFETGYYGNIVSGIYLYRIEVIGEGSIPRYSDMKKMLMIK